MGWRFLSYPGREVKGIGERSAQNGWNRWRTIGRTRTTTWRTRRVGWASGDIARYWDPIHRRRWCLGGTGRRRTAVRTRQMWCRPTEEWRTAGVTARWILRPGHWQLIAVCRASHNTEAWLYKHISITLEYLTYQGSEKPGFFKAQPGWVFGFHRVFGFIGRTVPVAVSKHGNGK